MDYSVLFWFVPAASLLALVFAWYFYKQMKRESEGTERMAYIAEAVRKGAMAYLKQQYKIVTIVFVMLAVIFAIMAYVFHIQNEWVPFAFLTGGLFSGLSGFLGMKTATTPYGRDAALNGFPYKVSDMLAHLDGATYITRQSVHTPANVHKCKKAIRKAFENSLAGNGYSMVEVVATCNSGWKMSPVEANKWMEENLLPAYPLGDIKCTTLPK